MNTYTKYWLCMLSYYRSYSNSKYDKAYNDILYDLVLFLMGKKIVTYQYIEDFIYSNYKEALHVGDDKEKNRWANINFERAIEFLIDCKFIKEIGEIYFYRYHTYEVLI